MLPDDSSQMVACPCARRFQMRAQQSALRLLPVCYRLLACIAPSMVIAQSLGAFSLLILVISSGFAIVRGSIPGW